MLEPSCVGYPASELIKPMRPKKLFAIGFIALVAFLSFTSFTAPQASAQGSEVQPRITQAVDEGKLTVLQGNTYPLARAEFDRGPAPASQVMETMMLALKRSPAQEATLDKLMTEQLDKSSPDFHKWLTPVEFGQQFGPSDQDIQVVTAWLESHGFGSVAVSNGRTVIEFEGNVGQVQAAFHTVIHNYFVDGKEHYANSSDPAIPAALTPVVAGVFPLHNFHKKPMYVVAHPRKSTNAGSANPLYTFADGCDQNGNCYGLGPTDFATIYDVTPLWNAGIDGTGQKIAIIGQSDVDMKDISTFRSVFGLPANAPNKIVAVPPGTDPGIVAGDETESDLDLEWAGGVAKGATLQFVVSPSVDLSAQYAVDHMPLVAPVLSESYGLCELFMGTIENGNTSSLWQQAATEGITVVVATGDEGSASCDVTKDTVPFPAQNGLQVSGLASTPYNVAVGGTDFNDLTNPTTYWNNSNNSTTLASAKSYIPETTWNSTCTNSELGSDLEANCNSQSGTFDFSVEWTVAGSGGASSCTASNGETPSSCSGGYAKPSWQVATGVPNDRKRDIPDISLFAGNGFNGNFFMVCAADQTNGEYCTPSDPNNSFFPLGGTSGSTPAFAAIMAMVNQKTGSTQGNANAVLYPMYASQPNAFHDVILGTIAVLCSSGSPNCDKTNSSDTYGILTGYNAGAGYDLATGLGSVDAANLVNNWTGNSTAPNFNVAFNPTTITIASPGLSGSATLTVSATNGFNGTVNFSCTNLSNDFGCSFSQQSVTGSGTTMVTITTKAASTVAPMRRPTGLDAGTKAFELSFVSIGMLWMAMQMKRRRWSAVAAAFAFCCLLGVAACGGGGSTNPTGGTQPVQNQSVIVGVSDGTTNHTATLSVTVN
jgi:subtilase family serine protease